MLPMWTLSASYARVERAWHIGELTDEQWTAYRAVWKYSAPRFSDLVPEYEFPRVRDAWALIHAREAVDR